jgi:hypothetical protein
MQEEIDQQRNGNAQRESQETLETKTLERKWRIMSMDTRLNIAKQTISELQVNKSFSNWNTKRRTKLSKTPENGETFFKGVTYI